MEKIKTYEEYIKLLEAELNIKGFCLLNDDEITAFIRKNQLDKYPGIVVKDVQSDVKTLINLHRQGKTAYTTGSALSNSRGDSGSLSSNQSTKLAKGSLLGLTGKTYTLESRPFSSGGEGDIYKIIGNPNEVVKVYHSDRISSELEKKLRYMANNPPASSVLTQVAWPMDVLYDEYRRFKGFVMPKLDITSELGNVYVYPPTKPEAKMAYNNKLILAMNICTVIHAVHNAGYVFGDFNPRNIGINTNSGKVAFLDTDSYHIVIDEKANKAYRCKVCLDGYVAPELLKQCEPYKKDAYANAPLPTFTKDTDNFALAIHIFKLLMNGYTPFNGIKQIETASTASPGIGNQAIKRDSYCFKAGNKPQAAAVPPASVLPDRIKKLFDRAFIDGQKDPKKRPDSKEWYSALSDYEKSLVRCPNNATHMYKKGLSSCPWCDADERYRQSINPMSTQRVFSTPVKLSPSTGSGSASGHSSGVVKMPTNTQTVTGSPVPSYVAVSPSSVQVSPKKSTLSAQKRVSKNASILYPISWIVFLINIGFCFAPFISNGSIRFDESVLYTMDYKLYTAFSIISVALMCFSTNLKCASAVGIVLSWIWSFIVCFGAATICYTQRGFNSSNASYTWKLFGILIVTFIAVLISSAKLGDIIRIGATTKQTNFKLKFRTFDVFLLILLIAVTVFCIPLLLNLSQFYSLASNYNLLVVGFWVAPVVLIIIFATSWNGNQIVGSWFCATMAVLFECVVLSLAAINVDFSGVVMLWLALAVVALILIVYMQSKVDNIVSIITVISFFVFFISGAYTVIMISSYGVYALGEGAHWWTVAPVIIDVIAAVIFSIEELVRK